MAKHLSIRGIVQGVGYRASFEAKARSLKLAGWVRNRMDGSVEAVVRGDDAALQTIIEWSRRGPAIARVEEVIVTDVDDSQVSASNFDVLATK